jgi:signal transduction histidine kinase
VISHDFRTPLNALLGYANLLAGEVAGRLNARQLTYVARVREVTSQLTGIVDDLLEYARVEAGSAPLTQCPVLPIQAAGEAIHIVQALADEEIGLRSEIRASFLR